MINVNKSNDITQAEVNVSLAGQKLSVSIFLIDGLLFDTGPSKMKQSLLPLLKEWDFHKIVLSHYHEDHTGLAPWAQENLHVPIFIHKNGIEECEKKAKLPLYRHLFWGGRESFHPFEIGMTVEGNQYHWEVIHTPGHSKDHIALFNRQTGVLMGGDLYVLMRPKSMFRFESVPTIIHSLKKVLTYDFETYVCSHTGILKDGRRSLTQKIEYLEEIQESVKKFYHQGYSKREIRKILLPNKHPLNYLSFFENSPIHIVNSIINNEEIKQ